jgi:CheY-like chemotaxis protein
VEVASSDRTAEVRVSDTGVGIDPAFLPYVFDPFRQADSQSTRRVGGIGLGLSIARRLVEAHDGSIRVESAGPGTGTTFVVTLPIVASRPHTAGPAADSKMVRPDRAPNLEGVRILAVDDDPDAREIIERAFERCKATVMTAGSASEAMDLLAKNDFNALLIDIAMPGEDGYALIRKVRALPSPQKASVPAAALTAYAREDQRRAALEAGFQLHIAKPIDPSQLVWSIAKLVSNRTSPLAASA